MRMREIASIEIHALVRELAPLEGSFFRKFYDLGDGAFKFTLSKERKNRILYINLLRAFNETEFSEEAESATQFAIAVRKRLDGTRLKSITQRGSDRIIVMEFEGKQVYKLIFEMFGKGNLVVVNGTGKIELVYSPVRQKDRDVLPNREYKFPESGGIPFDEAGDKLDDILEKAGASDARIITELSGQINLGPMYLEDVLLTAGINPKEKASATTGSHRKLREALLSFLRETENPRPAIYTRGGESVDYSLVPLKKYADLERIEYASLGALLDTLYLSERSKVRDDRKGEELKEARSNVEKQIEAAKRLKVESEESAKEAHLMLMKMKEINEIIAYMRANRRATAEELQGAFKNVKIKNIDLKNKTVTIEIGE